MIDHSEFVDAMNAKHGPLYAKGIIPAGTYPGQDKDNQIANVWNILVVHESMPADVAYQITKVIFEHTAEWATVHAEAKSLSLDNQRAANSPVPFHPGATKFYAERGVKLGS
jgi:uncharacterized protein